MLFVGGIVDLRLHRIGLRIVSGMNKDYVNEGWDYALLKHRLECFPASLHGSWMAVAVKDCRSAPRALRPVLETYVTRFRLPGSYRSQHQVLDRHPEEGMCEKRTLEIVDCVLRCVPFLK